MTKRINILLRWAARIFSILCVVIIMMFIVGEGFNPTILTLNEWFLFIFFPFGVAIGMILGWWKENVGGFITTCCFVLFYIVHYIINGRLPQGWAFLVFSSPGILFLLSWYYNRKINITAV